ncbi:MAG: cell division protein ZapA [Polyangia bacterium]
MKSLSITVGGHSFQIRSDASAEHVESLAAEVDRRFKAIEKRGPRTEQSFRAMAMVAIVLLDELLEARERRGEAIRLSREFAIRMIERIDRILSEEQS